MIHAYPTDTIFVSDLLPARHPSVFNALKAHLAGRLQTILCTNDIWCRDYMPIPVAPGRFVQFRYNPSYLKGYPHLRSEPAADLFGLTCDCDKFPLVIVGGNIVRSADTAILTDKVYSENRRFRPPELRERLRTILEVQRVVIIPREPGDPIGHADGILRFIDQQTVLVNDYRTIDPAYGRRLRAVLHRHGLRIVPFPYAPTNDLGPEGIPSAVGVYINFLLTAGILFCPIYGLPQDQQALRLLKRCYPERRIVPVRCRRLAAQGGVLNCVTWQIYWS